VRRTLLKAFVVLLLASGVVLAQDDLGWLENLLPDESTRQIGKVLRQGEAPVQVGDLLLNETFSALNAWETYTSRTGSLRITDGRYEIRFREQDLLLWGQNSDVHENVAIEVETEVEDRRGIRRAG